MEPFAQSISVGATFGSKLSNDMVFAPIRQQKHGFVLTKIFFKCSESDTESSNALVILRILTRLHWLVLRRIEDAARIHFALRPGGPTQPLPGSKAPVKWHL
jgi:hypothetical protein